MTNDKKHEAEDFINFMKENIDMKNNKVEFASKLLLEYAQEKGLSPRSTSDLSPLEEWLMLRLYYKRN